MRNDLMLQPMPSPRGTHHERLFILKGRANPQCAHDSLESARQSDTVAQIVQWAKQNLSHEEQYAIAERLQENMENTSATKFKSHRPDLASDESGRWARPAMSIAEAKSYGRSFVQQRQPAPRPVSTSVREDFFSRFPEAKRIGGV